MTVHGLTSFSTYNR